MKTYQQMAFEVLKARDAHLLKKQRRKALFRIYVPIATSFSFSVLLGLQFWQDRQTLPEVQHVPETDIAVTESETEYSVQLPTETAESITLVTETELPSETGASVVTTEMTEAETIPETEVQTETIMIMEIQETDISVPEVEETEPFVTEFTTETIPVTEFIPETEPSETETLPKETESNGIKPVLNQIVLHLSASAEDKEEEVIFCSTGYTVPEEYVREWLDTVDVMISYPDGTEQLIEHIGDAYDIENVLSKNMAAVQFSGDKNYYLFISEELSEEEFQRELEESGILK